MSIAPCLLNHLHNTATRYELLSHAPTGCSRETAAAARIPQDHLAKAVLLKDEEGYLLAVIPADGWLQLKRLRRELGRELELASETEIKLLFADCLPGAIPALGPAYQLETVLDEDLASLARVYIEGGDHRTLVQLSGDEFRQLMRGVRHGHFSARH